MREKVGPLDDAGGATAAVGRRDNGEKSRRPGRLLAAFKAVVLLALAATAAYGMLNQGLYAERLWLPVADGVLVVLLVTLFVRGYYEDVPQAAWIMVTFLAALVGVKGLSMVWTVSETETVNEVLRSSTYLALFVVALGALTSGRQVGPLMDVAILMVAAIAGYGLLQKINPAEYPIRSMLVDEVRVDSTLGYANSTAIVLAMGAALALARSTTMRNAILRGLYAALTLAFLITLYLTFSRGGIGSLVAGLILLFILTEKRLQTLVNLLILSVPGAWLLWRIQSLQGFLQTGLSEGQRAVLGTAFRNDLVVALAAAFVLQTGYALVVNRYELMPLGRRALGGLAVVAAVLAVGAGALAVVNEYGGVGRAYEMLVSNPPRTENAAQRLASLDLGFRKAYWSVGWEAWKERPLTGTGAGTFKYTWLENRTESRDVQQVHNLYLEQGTETGVFAFLALVGFVVALVGFSARAAWRARGGRRLLLAGLVSALAVYLVSSVLEWHWYIQGPTLFFFLLAATTAKFACREDWGISEADVRPPDGENSPDERP